MDSHAGDHIWSAIKALMVVCAVSVPLGLWKMVDLVMVIARHVSVHWSLS